jgi:hypothetical protein
MSDINSGIATVVIKSFIVNFWGGGEARTCAFAELRIESSTLTITPPATLLWHRDAPEMIKDQLG